jgi:hypothetical protein
MKAILALIAILALGMFVSSPGVADAGQHMSKIPGQASLPVWKVKSGCPGDCNTILAECRKGPKVPTPDGGDECDYFHAICICDRCGEESAQCKALSQ